MLDCNNYNSEQLKLIEVVMKETIKSNKESLVQLRVWIKRAVKQEQAAKKLSSALKTVGVN